MIIHYSNKAISIFCIDEVRSIFVVLYADVITTFNSSTQMIYFFIHSESIRRNRIKVGLCMHFAIVWTSASHRSESAFLNEKRSSTTEATHSIIFSGVFADRADARFPVPFSGWASATTWKHLQRYRANRLAVKFDGTSLHSSILLS